MRHQLVEVENVGSVQNTKHNNSRKNFCVLITVVSSDFEQIITLFFYLTPITKYVASGYSRQWKHNVDCG